MHRKNENSHSVGSLRSWPEKFTDEPGPSVNSLSGPTRIPVFFPPSDPLYHRSEPTLRRVGSGQDRTQEATGSLGQPQPDS